MREYDDYRYALSLTSQFYFCGLPLRLDAYNKCLFSCNYCFAAARGGKRSLKGLKVADSDLIDKALSRATNVGKPTTVIGQLLRHRQPIHFGGMSDPFPAIEAELGISLRLLRQLATDRYPTVISTKGILLGQDAYLELLLQGDFVVQFSFSTRDDQLAAELDHGAPTPTERIRALRELSNAGVTTAARLQPLIPGRELEASSFIEELADAGAQHVGIEYLKLPTERSSVSRRVTGALGVDLEQLYGPAGPIRSGREWILHPTRRLGPVLELRDKAHAAGLSFGAADCDFLPLSDGSCCCSSADTLLKSETQVFDFNYLGAVRRASSEGYVSFKSLQGCWSPEGSIAEMVMSGGRMPSQAGRGAGIRDYIRRNWNGRVNGCSPAMFYGVERHPATDDEGLQIYLLTDELRSLMSTRLTP
ncbi:radical SAM protein [Mycolicibacterium elephantis]